MTNLMCEMYVIFPFYLLKPKFVLKVWEDNQSCIAMTNNPNLHLEQSILPSSIIIFWKHVKTQSNPDGFIEIEYCSTEEQVADIFTKPVCNNIFFTLQKLLLNW